MSLSTNASYYWTLAHSVSFHEADKFPFLLKSLNTLSSSSCKFVEGCTPLQWTNANWMKRWKVIFYESVYESNKMWEALHNPPTLIKWPRGLGRPVRGQSCQNNHNNWSILTWKTKKKRMLQINKMFSPIFYFHVDLYMYIYKVVRFKMWTHLQW
jgi:hypothetical protein